MDGENETPHIAMIPTPGMGHLIPLAELARRLTDSFNFTITILVPNDGSTPSNSTLTLLNSLPTSITHRFLPPADISDLPNDAVIETRILLTLTRSIPQIRDSLRILSDSTRFVALVSDHFGSSLLDLAREYGALPYMFFLSGALGLCFGFDLPKLDKMYTCEFRDLPEPLQFCPGSVPIYGSDFIDPVQDRKSEAYKGMLQMAQRFRHVSGIFVNTFTDLEPAAVEYLMNDEIRAKNNIPPVYPVGPVVKCGLESESDGSICMGWLDKQPRGSVLFVSFGSGGSLSHEQIAELAYGLEFSGVRFLWVVKSPNDKIANASYFTLENTSDPLTHLPKGFVERTSEVGLVVPSWAPQVRVLSHGSTGGFLTHCGWNSTMESVVHGVPMIAWPLFAEQKFNAVILSDDLKVAFRVKPNELGLIRREQIVEYARNLIQGEEGDVMRDRMKELKDKAKLALCEGGSSHKSLTKVHDDSIVKVLWLPPEFGDAVACISADGALSLWEELVLAGQPLQWKFCTKFQSKTSRVLDIQFGGSSTCLKLVAAFSDGFVKVYELVNPLELNAWQLQAEFQNVIDSVSKFTKVSCLSATISWIPQRGESQQFSFVLGLNSNIPELNSSKIWEFDQMHQRWLPVAELAPAEDSGEPVNAVAWAPNIGRPFEIISVATQKGIAMWHVGLNPDVDGRLSVDQVALLSGHQGEVWQMEWDMSGMTLASTGSDRVVRLWQSNLNGVWHEQANLEPTA